ncbi:uncharacterized protein M6B38_179295 [Iris pallida]|uniref:Uncharacterized protein n=1 Tax=Iris pallida TaxID=29817 RepID=A0AAX6EN32_IRIPA|nr:uncharacterized protein M6B38_179295 [Iris pallida]
MGLSSFNTTTTSSRRNGRSPRGGADDVDGGRCCPRRSGCLVGMWRILRKMRKQSKMLCITSTPFTSAASSFNYDPASYARNFDHDGSLDDDDDGSNFLYTFSSRFVAAAKRPMAQANVTG